MITRLFTQFIQSPENDDAGGGGGGAAVAEAPPDSGKGEFTIPSVDDGEAAMDTPNPFGAGDPMGSTPTPNDYSHLIGKELVGEEGEETPPGDEPPETPEAPAKLAEKTPEEPAAPKTSKQLRELHKRDSEALRAAETERDELKKARETLAAEREDLAKRLEEREKEYVQAKATPPYSPAQDNDVVAIDREMGQLISRTSARLFTANENGPRFQASVVDLVNGYTRNMKEKGHIEEWREKVVEAYGDENLQRIEDAVDNLAQKWDARSQIIQKNSANWEETAQQSFESQRRELERTYATLGNLSDEEIEKSPHAANAIITRMARKDEKFAEAVKVIRRDAALIETGLPPLPRDADRETIEQYHRDEAAIQSARAQSVREMMEFRALKGVFSAMSREIEALRKRVKGQSAGSRPDSSFDPGGTPAPSAKGSGTTQAVIDGDQDYEETRNPYV